MIASDGPLFEHACNEGNYGLAQKDLTRALGALFGQGLVALGKVGKPLRSAQERIREMEAGLNDAGAAYEAYLELGLLGAQLGLVRLDAREVHGGIDLGDELTGLDRRSDLDVQLLQLPRHLRAHVDRVLRVEGTARRNGLRERTHFELQIHTRVRRDGYHHTFDLASTESR